MTTFIQIKEFVDKIVRVFAPERIVLFGSCANGNPTDDSDVDLFIVIRTKKNYADQSVDVRCRIPCDFPLDLVIRSPEETRRRVELNDVFVSGVQKEGYLGRLGRYIERNALRANIDEVRCPWDYHWCSAKTYVRGILMLVWIRLDIHFGYQWDRMIKSANRRFLGTY